MTYVIQELNEAAAGQLVNVPITGTIVPKSFQLEVSPATNEPSLTLELFSVKVCSEMGKRCCLTQMVDNMSRVDMEKPESIYMFIPHWP